MMKGICQACQKYGDIFAVTIGVPGSGARELKLCEDCRSSYEEGNISLDFIKGK